MIQIDKAIYEIEGKDIKSLFSEREKDSNKGTYGYVAIMGGCVNYAGAVKLASMSGAALRGGAGVVRVIIPASIVSSIGPYLLEQTIFPIPDKESHMLFEPKKIEHSLDKIKALAIGMGWGEGSDNQKILEYLLKNTKIRLLIDADGLNTLAHMDLEILKNTKAKIILTPHLKEFERISKIPMERIKKEAITIAKAFAKEYQIILLLKGPTTIVTDGEIVYLVKTGCPGMATAGSGDVLSGILVGMLGYQEPTALTISAGAYLAGVAGELAQQEKTDIGMIVSDTVNNIPKAIQKIRQEKDV